MDEIRRADPFCRVNVLKESALLLIEFCQVLGPKPIKCLPHDTTFNLDQIAVWIMSSENDHGSTVTIFNQQIGIYAIIHYSTLLDISARAFQRPFAIAYVSSKEINKKITSKFEQHVEKVVNPLLNCNMTMFTHLSEQMINLANAIEKHDFHQYYALTTDEPTLELSKYVQELVLQIKRVCPRFKNAYSFLSDNNDQTCSCGNSIDDFKKFFPLIGQASSTDLMPLFYLCPCGTQIFDENFQSFYNDITSKIGCNGVITVAETPVINNVKSVDNLTYPTLQSNFKYDNTLISFNRHLINIIFNILIGEPVIIAASKERESTMIDLLNKLSLLKPSKRKQETKILNNYESLADSVNSFQFFGIEMTRNDSLNWIIQNSSCSYLKIDLNNQKIRCIQYNGNLLKPFIRLNFPSDSTLLSYIAYILTNVNRITLTANNTSYEEVIRDFKLPEDDQEIISNFLIELDVIKHGYLLKPHEKPTRKTVIHNIT